MHVPAEPVPHQFAHHRKAVRFGMLLHSRRDISDAVARLRLCDTFIKSFFGHLQ